MSCASAFYSEIHSWDAPLSGMHSLAILPHHGGWDGGRVLHKPLSIIYIHSFTEAHHLSEMTCALLWQETTDE